MAERTSYTPGTFCWVDLMTTDAKASTAFYSEVMAWKFEAMPTGEGPDYMMAQVNGKDVAALFEMTPEMKKNKLHPSWQSYISVPNLDEVTQKFADNGGKVLEKPFDVMEAGRMSVVQDNVGGVVSLWQAKKHFGAEWVNHPGGFCWNELCTDDPGKAKSFYHRVFNQWNYTEMEGPNPYISIQNDEKSNGGILDTSAFPPNEKPPTHWNVYFTVDNIKTATDRVKSSGGKILHGPAEIPDVGTFATMMDPQGATSTLMQLNKIED